MQSFYSRIFHNLVDKWCKPSYERTKSYQVFHTDVQQFSPEDQPLSEDHHLFEDQPVLE